MAEPCTWLPGDPRDLLTAAEKAALLDELRRISIGRGHGDPKDFTPTLAEAVAAREAPPYTAPEQVTSTVVLHKCGSCWRKFAGLTDLMDHEARHAREANEVSSARDATPGHHQPT